MSELDYLLTLITNDTAFANEVFADLEQTLAEYNLSDEEIAKLVRDNAVGVLQSIVSQRGSACFFSQCHARCRSLLVVVHSETLPRREKQ